MDQRAELPQAQRQLLLAMRLRSAAIEAWALALTRGENSAEQLEELTRQQDEAQAEVTRCEALVEAAGMPSPPESGASGEPRGAAVTEPGSVPSQAS